MTPLRRDLQAVDVISEMAPLRCRLAGAGRHRLGRSWSQIARASSSNAAATVSPGSAWMPSS